MQVFVRFPFAESLRAVFVSPLDPVSTIFTQLGNGEINDRSLCLRCRGRTVSMSASFQSAGVSRDAVIEVLPRLLGGGGDGGSTGAESRSAYLEMYRGKRHDKVNPEEERLARWTTCRLSGMPLQPPCVIDELGNLYNKEAMVHALLNKSIPEALSYITSLKKHLRDVHLHNNPSYSNKDGKGVQYACPVTGIPMNGKARFVAVCKTQSDEKDKKGSKLHILSEKAIKDGDLRAIAVEIIGGGSENGKGTANDSLEVTPVLPIGEELDSLREAILAKRAEDATTTAFTRKKKKKVVAYSENIEKIGEADAQILVKKQKTDGTALRVPDHADVRVYNSLFHSKEAANDPTQTHKKKGHTTTDYMVRGTMKYVA